jgi:formyltetrahydrofolate-dependent phosphoribosylglycinamide formyltransferase
MMSRIAVFVSGRGSNLQALHAYLARAGGAEVALVVSDRASSGALTWARERGITTATLDSGRDDASAILEWLAAARADLVVLAGYLRLVPPAVVRAYRGRMVNVHPALLPAFGGSGMYGPRVHRAVLDAGVRVTGPTVHFVDEVYDHGAIIAQWPVPVFADDTDAALAARVLRAEHLLLPRVVHLVSSGRIALDEDGRVAPAHALSRDRAAFLFATPEEDALADSMASALGG